MATLVGERLPRRYMSCCSRGAIPLSATLNPDAPAARRVRDSGAPSEGGYDHQVSGRSGRAPDQSYEASSGLRPSPTPSSGRTLVGVAGGIYEQRQQRLLELLLEAGDRPLSLQALEAAGVASPATVI